MFVETLYAQYYLQDNLLEQYACHHNDHADLHSDAHIDSGAHDEHSDHHQDGCNS